ncbi:MAG: tetratricopeptide repeat protein [Rhizobiaceae bacterium]
MRFRNIKKIAFISSLVISFASHGTAFANKDAEETDLSATVAESSLSGSFLAGQVAAKGNDDVAAVAFYERSLELDPENSELKRLLFLALAANGRIDDAVVLAREGNEIPQEATFTRLVIAVDLLKNKSWKNVAETLNTPAGSELDKLVENLVVAWSHFGSGETARALELASKIDGPEWVVAIRNYHSGLMSAAIGNDEAAIRFFKETTKDRAMAGVLTATFMRAIEALALAQQRMGDQDEALKSLRAGQDLLASHPPFKHRLIEFGEGKTPPPLVTSAQQGGAEIFFNVGSALSQQGGAPFAQSHLQLARFLNPKSDVIAISLAGLFEKQKRHKRANEYYEAIEEDSAYFRRSQLEYALNLNDLEESETAITILSSLLESEPDDLLTYLTLGSVYAQDEEYGKAAEIYDRAVERIEKPESQHWNLFYRRGIAYERTDQWEKAEPNFKKSLELLPNQPDVLNYLGYSWVDMGINLDEGMDMIRKAVELKPRSGFIVDSLGWAHYKLGNYPEAVKELERAVNLMPEDPVVNDHLGDAYWKVGRKLEATFQWNHALASKPTLEERIKIEAKLRNGLKEEESTAASEQ